MVVVFGGAAVLPVVFRLQRYNIFLYAEVILLLKCEKVEYSFCPFAKKE